MKPARWQRDPVPAPHLTAVQGRIWHEVRVRSTAFDKLQDGEEISEDELLELVEYGQLSVVSREWMARNHTTGDEDYVGNDTEQEEAEGETVEGVLPTSADDGFGDPDGAGGPAGAEVPAASPWPADPAEDGDASDA